MADQANIFNESNNESALTEAQKLAAASGQHSNDNVYADLLNGIRNSDGVPKYKDVPTALAALAASQSFIETLKTEKAETERKLAEAANGLSKQEELERTVRELISKQNEQRPTGDAQLTPEQIAEMVNRTLSANQQQQSAKQNQQQVAASLKQQFGEKAEEAYNAAAEENGFTVAEFNALAAKSPKAVLKMLGVQQTTQSNTFAPNRASINSGGFKPNQESFVKRNTTPVKIGATTADTMTEFHNSSKMVEELAAQGLSVHDLSDPKLYSKYFGN